MSNQAVGNVYQAIIDEVINNSRVDFEESGVEESVLEELRQVSLLSILPTSACFRSRQSHKHLKMHRVQRPPLAYFFFAPRFDVEL